MTSWSHHNTVLSIRARHTGYHARPTSLGLYVMYPQTVQSVRSVESTVVIPSEPSFCNTDILLLIAHVATMFCK